MRETGVFFGFLFVCLVLGALLAYPLAQADWIAQDPHRIMGRAAQVFILLGLWPFLVFRGLDNRAALGFGAGRSALWRALWQGWLAGVATLLILVGCLLALAVRVPDAGAVRGQLELLEKAIRVFAGGLVTALLEETFFRGALYSAIRHDTKGGLGDNRRLTGGPWQAIFWSSLLFSLLHFMRPHPLPDGVVFDWTGSLQMFVHVFAGVFQWKHVDAMTALFLVGVLLAWVRERSGHIGWCIGIHAGWIFVIGVTRHLTDGNGGSPHAWMVGSYDGVVGWLAALWVLLMILGFGWMTAAKGRSSSRRGRAKAARAYGRTVADEAMPAAGSGAARSECRQPGDRVDGTGAGRQ